MHVLTMALLAKWRYLLSGATPSMPTHPLHISRYDCGLFMTGTRGELFATHVIALFIQVRSCSK